MAVPVRMRILVLGVVCYAVLWFECAAFSDSCYMSEDAWLYIPLMASVPGFLAQGIVVVVKLSSLTKTLLRSAIAHAMAAFLVIRIWLLITGQPFSFAMLGSFDVAFFLGGAIMGAIVYVSRTSILQYDWRRP